MKVVPIACKHIIPILVDNIYEVKEVDHDCHWRNETSCSSCLSSPNCSCPQKLEGKGGKRFYVGDQYEEIDRL